MHSIRFFSQIIRLYRARMTAVLSMQLLAAVAEAFGVATLLPLLLLVTGPTTGSQSVVVRGIAAGLATIGLPFSLPVLLVVLVIAVFVKTIFTFIAWRQIGAATAAVAADMRYRLLLAVSRARWAYFVDQPIGSLSNAVGGQTMRAAGAFMLVCEVIAQGLQLLVYIALAVLVTPWYVLAAAGAIAAILFVSMRRVRDARRDAEVRETRDLVRLHAPRSRRPARRRSP
jgi:ATP-binding cassette subfamily C protein